MSRLVYRLRRNPRARALRIAVHPDGTIILTAPSHAGMAVIERFFARHHEWVRRHVAAARSREVIRVRRADIPQLKRRAQALARSRAEYFAERYGIAFGCISIRAQRTRWGSCSRRGDLAFNYKLAALPPELSDYIVIHEICHRLEMNHSARFWAHVSRAIPRHKELRKRLRNIAFVFE